FGHSLISTNCHLRMCGLGCAVVRNQFVRVLSLLCKCFAPIVSVCHCGQIAQISSNNDLPATPASESSHTVHSLVTTIASLFHHKSKAYFPLIIFTSQVLLTR